MKFAVSSPSILKRLVAVPALALACVSALVALAAPARAQEVIWEDDFPAAAGVDSGKWTVSDSTSSVHRTRFGAPPQLVSEDGISFARMRLQTYNPTAAGQSFLGSEMWSRQEWDMGPGMEWEARVRGTNVPRGICYAFFTYKRRDFAIDDDQEEIDFEFISNFINDPSQSGTIWTNIWNGTRTSSSLKVNTPGLNQTQWHTYTMRWTNTGVQWLVDGNVIRTETNIVPDDQMAVCFNIWAPNSSWDEVYSNTLNPTSNPNSNQTSYFDVDWVRVRRMATPTNQGSVGGGGGLTGVYYNSAIWNNGVQFSQEQFADIEPRLNFSNWNTTTFDSRIGVDNWGAVFKGDIQAQYSQSTTLHLTTHSTDGARLYLNGALLIDKRPGTGDTLVDSNAAVSLQAGQRYAIRIEFYDGTGAAALKLAWSSASLPRQFVATTQLYPVLLPITNLSPTPDVYYTPQTVTVTNSEPGVDIHYTTDGSEPQRTNTEVAHGGTLSITRDTRLKIKAWKDGYWSGPTRDGFYAIVADTQAPTVAIENPHPTGAWTYRTLPTAGGSVVENGTSGLDRVSVRLSRGDGAFWNPGAGAWTAGPIDFPATVNGGSWSVALPGMADGAYTLRAAAFDRVGNSAATSALFYIDTVAPSATVNAPAAGAFLTAVGIASGNASDTGTGVGSVRATLRRGDGLFWNGGGWSAAATDLAAAFSIPVWSLALPALGDGAYTLSVTARDWAGNEGAPAVRHFTIDATPPAVSSALPNNTVQSLAFTLSGSAGDTTSGAVGVAVRVQRGDGLWWNGAGGWGASTDIAAGVAPAGAGALSWSLEIPLFGDNNYTATIMARDRANNYGQTTVSWRADGSAPNLVIGAPANGSTLAAWLAPRGSVSDGAAGVGVDLVEVAIRSGVTFWNGNSWVVGYTGHRAALNGASWAWPAGVALPPNANGAYRVSATTIDFAGNVATVVSDVTLAVPPPAPTPTPVPTATAVPNAAPTAIPTATPTARPTATPVATPTAPPVVNPTATPLATPTARPTVTPPPPAPVDRVAPIVRITSPAPRTSWRTVPPLRGVATDNVGIARVDLVLYRYADRRYWNGRAWVTLFTVVRATVSGVATSQTWWHPSLPGGLLTPTGNYALTALAYDRANLRGATSVIFTLDQKAPVASFVVPKSGVQTSAPSRVVVQSLDAESGTRGVDLLLVRRSDGLYWNGRGWQSGAARMPARALTPTPGPTPTSVLWQNILPMPTGALLPASEYELVAVSRDATANQGTARMRFTIAAPSPFTASTASATGASVTVVFTGALNPAVAQAPARYTVRVAGAPRGVLAARYTAATRSVTLTLAGSVPSKARIDVAWNGLLDASGRAVRNAAATVIAP